MTRLHPRRLAIGMAAATPWRRLSRTLAPPRPLLPNLLYGLAAAVAGAIAAAGWLGVL